jgi:hypothetical protein
MAMQKISLQPLITITAAQIAAGTGGTSLYNINEKRFNQRFVRGMFTLRVTTCTAGGATYNFYVHSYQILPSGTYSRWDVCAFPQITADAVRTYTIFCNPNPPEPLSVTTAGPGVAAILSGSLRTDTAASNNGICTATAGMAYHATLGEGLSYSLIGSAGAGPITFEIAATVYDD